MLLEQGWLAGARRVPHHITIAARMTKHPPCWWCTILACRRASLAVRGSTHYSLELLIRRRILSLRRSPICASPLTV